jgi:hypothetical protein
MDSARPQRPAKTLAQQSITALHLRRGLQHVDGVAGSGQANPTQATSLIYFIYLLLHLPS